MLRFWTDVPHINDRGSLTIKEMGQHDNVRFERTGRYPTGATTRFALLHEKGRDGYAIMSTAQHRREVSMLVFEDGAELDDCVAAARAVCLSHKWFAFIMYQGNPAQRVRDLEITEWL